MTEIFDELSEIDEPVMKEDRVVYLLAGLPECYSVLVTALEASSEVPKLTVVTERLLHEEAKMKSRSSGYNQEGALMTRFRKKQRCYFVTNLGMSGETARSTQGYG